MSDSDQMSDDLEFQRTPKIDDSDDNAHDDVASPDSPTLASSSATKRGRGRPPKDGVAAASKTTKSSGRGRGRPPKSKENGATLEKRSLPAKEPESDSDEDEIESKETTPSDIVKKSSGRGRPKKSATKSPGSGRGRGRPPTANKAAKETPSGSGRGRGRPPKAKTEDEEAPVAKTGKRGRPAKSASNDDGSPSRKRTDKRAHSESGDETPAHKISVPFDVTNDTRDVEMESGIDEIQAFYDDMPKETFSNFHKQMIAFAKFLKANPDILKSTA